MSSRVARQVRIEETTDRDEEGVEIEAAQASLRVNPVHDPWSVGGRGVVLVLSAK